MSMISLSGARRPRRSALFCLFRVCQLLAVLALAALGQPGVRAEFIQPVAVQVTNGEASQETLIDGSGLNDGPIGSPESIHSQSSGDMWSGIGSIRESATFDLGQTISLTKVYIWNYNAPNASDVGMKEVEVQVSAQTDLATATFNAIAKISLKEGGENAQVFDVAGTSVRLVRLKGLSNWGQGFTVGLAEVRFESGEIAGNVPTITINSPHEGDEIAFGTALPFDLKLADRDSDLQKVEYFDNDVLVTNRTAAPFNVTLPAPAKGEHAYRVVVTDRTGKSAWVTVNVNVRELVADRIIKIDDTEDQGPGLNQIRYQGTWNLAQGNANDPRYKQNDHYNLGGNRVDYFEVKFAGVKIDLFGTVASHHGSAFASIDGGPEFKVVYKATQRKEQVFVWGSPILANREHTLRVRTAGDGVVTADRFDISVSDRPDVATAKIKSVSFTQVVIEMEDVGGSVVDDKSVRLFLDNVPATSSALKAGSLTTITHTPATPFTPGSAHTARVEAKDKAGSNLNSELPFNLPAPFFPLSGLGGPDGAPGQWGLRQIWNAGRVDAIVVSANLAAAAQRPGFTGRVNDAQAPVINFSLSGNPGISGVFPDESAFPGETAELSGTDFILLGKGYIRIPRAGDWTIGVHSDDGFALRFIGAPFASVSGNGVRDDNFPEYIGFLTETGNSDTRGVLKAIPAGIYGIEFIGFQRTGGASFEIYAAEGAFEADGDTETWQLIGASEGLELVAPPTPPADLRIQRLAAAAGTVTIEFQSPRPDGSHQLLESNNLRDWRAATGVTFVKTGERTVRATLSNTTARATFYQIQL